MPVHGPVPLAARQVGERERRHDAVEHVQRYIVHAGRSAIAAAIKWSATSTVSAQRRDMRQVAWLQEEASSGTRPTAGARTIVGARDLGGRITDGRRMVHVARIMVKNPETCIVNHCSYSYLFACPAPTLSEREIQSDTSRSVARQCLAGESKQADADQHEGTGGGVRAAGVGGALIKYAKPPQSINLGGFTNIIFLIYGSLTRARRHSGRALFAAYLLKYACKSLAGTCAVLKRSRRREWCKEIQKI